MIWEKTEEAGIDLIDHLLKIFRTVLELDTVHIQNKQIVLVILDPILISFVQTGNIVNTDTLLIYLRSSIPNLVSQIQKRGREYEKSIRIDYITGLNERYENWIKDYKHKLLVLDVDRIKFENRPEDFQEVVDKIDAELFGLFPAE